MSKLNRLNDSLGWMKKQWWCSDEYLDLIDQVRTDTLFLWETVAERQDELKTIAVGNSDFVGAQLHKDLRDYAEQCWHIHPLDQTHEWWDSQSACVKLLCDIEEARVDWSDVFVYQHELMIQAGARGDLDAAIFHKKLKQYAGEVFADDESIVIGIPGQTGEG